MSELWPKYNIIQIINSEKLLFRFWANSYIGFTICMCVYLLPHLWTTFLPVALLQIFNCYIFSRRILDLVDAFRGHIFDFRGSFLKKTWEKRENFALIWMRFKNNRKDLKFPPNTSILNTRILKMNKRNERHLTEGQRLSQKGVAFGNW